MIPNVTIFSCPDPEAAMIAALVAQQDPFIKQLGSRPMLDGEPLKLRHQHGARMEEWPEDLRVQEWPED